jgi:hypothetical protein
MNKAIWVLTDDKTGNNNQAIALAEELGLGYEIKKLSYNLLGKLPNLFFRVKPLHVNRKLLESLLLLPPPEIIITSGRKTAAVAVYLKKKYQDKIKIIQIMRPSLNPDLFDLIILPQHDTFNYVSSRVVRIIGALGNIKTKLQNGKRLIDQHYPEAKDFIAVFLGGSTKGYSFKAEIAQHLADTLEQVSNNHCMHLFISFSRRTPEAVKKIIRERFSKLHIIYDPSGDGVNPYFGMLSEAKKIIVTSDSISMCSEIASTGKPFYIFCPDEFKLKKHRFFIQQLIDLGVAKKLDLSSSLLKDYSYEPLCEVTKVANIIKDRIYSANLNN